ncbi:MAG: YkvA family protein [Desulfobacterales bacterium]
MNDPQGSSFAAIGSRKRPRSRTAGVAGIGDPKWIAVGLCYIAAIALMGQDPWYGEKYFTYNQGIFVGILAVLLVAGFCWEIYLLGRPGGINLVLHCLLILPVALLIGRIAGLPPAPEVSYGLLGQFKSYISSLKDASGIESILPYWLQDIFRNPSILLLIFFTAMAFTQKRPSRRFALVVVAFLIPVMQTLTHEPRPSIAFGLGFFAMLVGIALQYSNFGDIIGQQNVLQRLQAVDDRLELKCSLRVAKQTVDDGSITEDGVLAIVQREYSRQFDLDPLAVRGIAQAISHRLVREHRILELRGDERGFFLTPSEALFKIEALFDEIAVWIRKIIITGIAIIWLISPIDLFPDSIPILGAIDDALIALVGAGQWVGTIKRRKLPGP